MTEYKNEFLEALRKPPRPGFNKLERDWYFERFISEAKTQEAFAKLVESIAQALNEPLEVVGTWVMEASAGDPVSTGKLIRWLPEIAKLDEVKELSRQHSFRDMAGLMLCSRLPVAWVVSNRERLETDYLISFPNVQWEFLENQKARDWLKSDGRWEVVKAITDMLPGSMIQELYEYGTSELFDGNPPPSDEESEGNAQAPPSPEPESTTSDLQNTGMTSAETLPISA